MYEWVRPKIVVPVHGEARHLAEHARLALEHGVPSALVQKNGDVIRLAPGDENKIGEVRVGRLILDGDVILPADGATINERRRMSFSGLITVAVPVGPTASLPVRRSSARSGFRSRTTARFHRRRDRRCDEGVQPGDEDKMRDAVRLAVAAARLCGRARSR
jgi:ribonuclease J